MITLTNVGTNYDSTSASRGLGLGYVDFTNKTAIKFAVYVNKVGTGTQSWQLWSETAGAEIGVINDAGAAGVKLLQQDFAVALTGIHLVRVRPKSTVAGDDPIFFGAAIMPLAA